MKKILVGILAATAFLLFYGGGPADAYPAGGIYGRAEYRGYFTNTLDVNGTYVLDNVYGGNAFPAWVSNSDTFLGFIETQLLTGNNQQRTGAAFIIQTMIGSSRNRPPTGAEITEWENRVRAMEAQGRINWFFNYSFTINSYFQGNRGGSGTNDDAFYDDVGSGPAIVFFNPNGTHYAIRRQCANPVGIPSPLQPAPSINFNVGGWVVLDNNSPAPGDTINFDYYIQNNGPTGTAPYQVVWSSYNPLTGAIVSGPNNSLDYAGPEQKHVGNEPYVVPGGTPPGTQICRQLIWEPVTQGGGTGYSPIVCATVRYDYTLTPSITIEINDGASSGPSNIAEPGDKVEFIYAVTNSGATDSQTTNCTIYGLSRTGFYAIPTPNDSSSDPGFTQPAHGCPRIFPWSATPSATNLVTETIAAVPASDANRSICRTLSINPSSQSGGTATTEVCVRIAAKPYLRVYGGDISAGGGQTTSPGTCANNTNAAIIGWNQGAPGTYAGAGVQYAAMALGRIYDVATSLGNGGGAGPPPSGLAFANTSPSGSIFGGSYGVLPCVENYYNTAGASPLTSGNLASLSGSNRYAGTGPITLGGNISPGQKSVVYIEGDVLINSNITYTGSWNASNIPLLQLVVRGDIYISRNVTQLDGIFIAQPNGATGGNIHTCANPSLPATAVPTTGGSVYTNCRNKLTINGAFIAKRVGFLRTNGSLRQAATGETGASANIAEVFNFSPALWMVQPPTTSGSGGEYDAITGLPPVL